MQIYKTYCQNKYLEFNKFCEFSCLGLLVFQSVFKKTKKRKISRIDGTIFIVAFQGCPCPMQSCPKNVDTGALIGNGKGAPVVSGPGLSLPPSALVGPPSPARGLAGLAPPHGANAWDTDRVQINTHRNLNQNQPPSVPPSHNLVGGHSRLQSQDCRSKVCIHSFLNLDDRLF